LASALERVLKNESLLKRLAEEWGTTPEMLRISLVRIEVEKKGNLDAIKYLTRDEAITLAALEYVAGRKDLARKIAERIGVKMSEIEMLAKSLVSNKARRIAEALRKLAENPEQGFEELMKLGPEAFDVIAEEMRSGAIPKDLALWILVQFWNYKGRLPAWVAEVAKILAPLAGERGKMIAAMVIAKIGVQRNSPEYVEEACSLSPEATFYALYELKAPSELMKIPASKLGIELLSKEELAHVIAKAIAGKIREKLIEYLKRGELEKAAKLAEGIEVEVSIAGRRARVDLGRYLRSLVYVRDALRLLKEKKVEQAAEKLLELKRRMPDMYELIKPAISELVDTVAKFLVYKGLAALPNRSEFERCLAEAVELEPRLASVVEVIRRAVNYQLSPEQVISLLSS